MRLRRWREENEDLCVLAAKLCQGNDSLYHVGMAEEAWRTTFACINAVIRLDESRAVSLSFCQACAMAATLAGLFGRRSASMSRRESCIMCWTPAPEHHLSLRLKCPLLACVTSFGQWDKRLLLAGWYSHFSVIAAQLTKDINCGGHAHSPTFVSLAGQHVPPYAQSVHVVWQDLPTHAMHRGALLCP